MVYPLLRWLPMPDPRPVSAKIDLSLASLHLPDRRRETMAVDVSIVGEWSRRPRVRSAWPSTLPETDVNLSVSAQCFSLELLSCAL